MSRPILLTEDAVRDLDDIHAFVAAHDGVARADRLVDGIGGVLTKLAGFPERGEYPKELASLGIRQFRQVHHKPYRMICQTTDEAITVMLIADGRRDMQSLLQRRLLG
ncbi:MAG: type II toxin-antitoxin system RelE/ParE family toxin [Gammaproteobacteria bacterium]|nr:type II toxin-antitoxin system RelE/ParE family toxin [Gammaproteobacteria bacterium]